MSVFRLCPANQDRLKPMFPRHLMHVIVAIAFSLMASHLLQTRVYATTLDDSTSRPNVVFILADDLGYGDVKCFGGSKCQIETPGFDRLAREGMRFTDAHANASVCVPTRMAIMTGRYPWRFGATGPGGPWGFLGTKMPPGTHTLGSMMKSAGYKTGYVGKWHLGTRMRTTDGKPQGPTNVDYGKPLEIGPAQYGFDESFILPGSLDMYPYVFARNNRWIGEVTAQKGWSAFHRVGPAAADFEDTKVLDTFSSQAESFIAESAGDAKQGNPFFLYLALTAPHTPTSPSADFEGKSKIGIYGDFVMEADHCVVRMLKALDKHEIADNTLVIATSDHGPASYAGRIREATYLQMKELEKDGHYAGGPFRGYKFSIYEGGLRVPFVARWPRLIPAATSCDRLIGLHDLMATLADICRIKLDSSHAPDSISILPLMKDPAADATRETMILQSTGATSVRAGDWKLALCPGSGSVGRWGNTPKRDDAWRQALKSFGRVPQSHDDLLNPKFVQLFNLADDPGETNNVASQRMDKVRELFGFLRQAIDRGRSTPGKQLKNARDNIQPFSGVPAFVWKKPDPQAARIDCVETDDAIVMSFGGKTLLAYNKSIQPSPQGIDPVYARGGYIHPICTPSGRVVTGDFPPDHPHQHALFNAWVRTSLDGKPIDFWNQKAGQGRVVHDKVVKVQQLDGAGQLEVELLHEQLTGDDGPRPVLRETLSVTAYPPQGNVFVFDIESTQRCIADSPLTVSKYHYGGMALRGSNQWFSESTAAVLKQYQNSLKKDPSLAMPLLEDCGHRFLTSEGHHRFDGNHSRPRWVDISGYVDGKMAGVTVMGHRHNFRFPQPVRLHPSKPYFCFAPMVVGDFKIEAGKPYVARYRYVVHDGPPEEKVIESHWKSFR